MITQKEFVRQVAKATGFQIAGVNDVFKAMHDVLIEDLRNQEAVKLMPGLVLEGYMVPAHEKVSPFKGGHSFEVPDRIHARAKITEGITTKLN